MPALPHFVRASIAAALTFGCVQACSNETAQTDTRARDSANLDTALPDSASDRFEFPWPTSPEDPVLQLDVEIPGQRRGLIEVELMPELAPRSVARIMELTREAYYDETTFHRVIPGFMIQGGDPKSRDQDPSNDGKGGIEAGLPDETSRAPFERGVVALASRGRPSSNSSQIFIMLADHPELDGRYTILGRVVSGSEIADAIAATPTDRVGRWGPKDRPIESVVIHRASIRPTAAEAPAPARIDPGQESSSSHVQSETPSLDSPTAPRIGR